MDESTGIRGMLCESLICDGHSGGVTRDGHGLGLRFIGVWDSEECRGLN